MAPLPVLDVFSGVGGMGLLLQDKQRPVMYVERKTDAQRILRQRMADGFLTKAPIHDDICTLKGTDPHLKGVAVKGIRGGFPCQMISSIGKRTGLVDSDGQVTESGLFFEIIRLAKELNVDFLFLENVQFIISSADVWNPIMQKINGLGFNAVWLICGACHLGGHHHRHRWFCYCWRAKHKSPYKQPVKEVLPKSGAMIGGVIKDLDHLLPECLYHNALPGAPHVLLDKRSKQYHEVNSWSTPRQSGGTSLYLTKRARGDLGTQLRYATDTNQPKLQYGGVGVKANPEWVEWLQGLPIGWTSFKPLRTLRILDWKSEPKNIPRLIDHNDDNSNKRHILLGNVCVPQCSLVAWDLLLKAKATLA